MGGFPEKRLKGIFVYVLELMLTLDKMQNKSQASKYLKKDTRPASQKSLACLYMGKINFR